MEYILFSIRCTLVDGGFYDFLFFAYLLAIASFAFIFLTNLFSLTTTIIAWACPLSIHTWPNHLHFGHHLLSFASAAFLDTFTSLAFAFGTYPISAYNDFSCFPVIKIFKSSLNLMHDGLSFLRASLLLLTSHSSVKHVEDVHSTSSKSTTSLLDAFLTIFIVKISFFGVGKNFISNS